MNTTIEMEQLAEQGDPKAQFELGIMYFQQRDIAQAKHWLSKAGEQGVGPAQVNMGIFCQSEGDLKQAMYWFEKADVENDIAEAQFLLSTFYTDGVLGFIKQDRTEARKYLEKAANQGHPDAQYMLGLYYKNGEGGLEENP